MITQEQVSGTWNQFKGKIQEQWGQLTDDELHEVEGRIDQLVGLIQQKTGETKGKIEAKLEQLNGECDGRLAAAAESARQYVDQASESVSQAADQVRQQATERYADAQQFVRRRPAESVAVAFGTGMIAGLIVGLIGRSR